MVIFLPETKGIPLEEVAKIFGDQEEVVVFSSEIQAGNTEDDLVVKESHAEADTEGSLKETHTHRENVV